ncbi:MAG: FAD-dependent oxidoreductase [Syntrophales bacterium]|nr:FAD-dependent oxidoreductase [Syntrophales bacterium]
MKRSKDRLHKVIVIGATPAGISATNKLGELGIPVTLVDNDCDLDLKLSRDDWKLNSGLPLNHAHRPGLIRILRNSAIQCVMPAEITSIKHAPQGFRVRINKIQTFVDPDRCTLCGRCVEICPVSVSEEEKAIKINSRRSLPGRAVIDKRRQPLCQENCPLGVNVQGYIALTKAGRYQDALDLIRKDNVLPGICGRVCTHPCEKACLRGDLDEPISIRDIKRFLADYEISHPGEVRPSDICTEKTEKIAVIGSGPAGLAAAADLARLGYQVTVFEKNEMAGGMLRYVVGPHRLPRDILDIEIEYIRRLGVKFVTGHPVDFDHDLKQIRKDFDAVILAVGTWADESLGAPGEDLAGIEGSLPFLEKVCRGEIRELKESVAVIGGGNSAIDVARALVRLGASPTVLYRRRKQDMPADPEEIAAALEEGVTIKDCTQVVAFKGKNEKLDRLQCMSTQPGEPDARGIPRAVVIPGQEAFELNFDRVFVAIGQTGNFNKDSETEHENPPIPPLLKGGKGGFSYKAAFNVTGKGLIEVDESMRTSLEGVYASGDAVSGPSSVVEAMASGKAAARSVHRDISGKHRGGMQTMRPEDKEFPDISADIPSEFRPTMPERQPAVRKEDFSEVALGLNEPQVSLESGRCLQCGVCSECLECIYVCDAIKAVNHGELPEKIIDNAGVLIIADPEIAPRVRGEDVIRAYGPMASKTDVYAMIMRGFAAAAKAMTLLQGTTQRLRGHGISVSPPDPGLSPDIRLGIFVCRCNDSLGWLDGMSEYVNGLSNLTEVVHAEEISSACTPEGSTRILRTIREKGITRMVLASCVCCPMNFACSACTDQRSRLKHSIFTGSGVSRAMVETCNLRGEVLRLIGQDPSLALNRFSGLIDRSVRRARILKSLPVLARNYNFTTAVIGKSEAAFNSVFTLAEAGLEVFWFGSSENPVPEQLSRPNVHIFSRSSVERLSGTLGNFNVFVESDGFQQTLRVGAVILDEKSRKAIQYIQTEGLSGQIKTVYQQEGIPGISFFYPGATSISGLFLADPPGVNVSKRKKGMAAAVLAATVMPRGPRQSKGFTVVVDETLCRGCGRCLRVCPYMAVSLKRNAVDGWCASVDEALCKGCGNCISVCPTNAADSPYRSQRFLERMLEELL